MVDFSFLQLHLKWLDSALHGRLLDSFNDVMDHLSSLSMHVQFVNQPAGQRVGNSVIDPGSHFCPARSYRFKSHFHLHLHPGEGARESLSCPELAPPPSYQFPLPLEFTTHDLANMMTDHSQTIWAWQSDDPRFAYEPGPFRVIIAPVRKIEHVFSRCFHSLGCLDKTHDKSSLTFVQHMEHING